ncbi:hypothetical protein FGO68_gene3110 [Halteria grandinella]|uniref:Bromo domain-containing protein n=1 Tax=Halteria grandinella TaxID=5974 RepID=A0A8J8NVC9_HALGN|nr:hypothetical protein FGO68_gene3110 [Halteria grandinella]
MFHRYFQSLIYFQDPVQPISEGLGRAFSFAQPDLSLLIDHLKQSIAGGNLEDVQILCHEHLKDTDFTLLKADEHGRSLLFLVQKIKDAHTQLEMTKYLVERLGINPLQIDCYGQTILFFATSGGLLHLARYLISLYKEEELQAFVDHIDSLKQWTPLFYAVSQCHIDFIRLLVEHGANVNHIDSKGETPLFLAARSRKVKVLETLLSLGADCNYVNPQGVRVLQIAQKLKIPPMIAIIKKRLGSPATISKPTSKPKPTRSANQKQEKKEEQKTFQLTKLVDGEYVPLTTKELQDLINERPDLADIFKDQLEPVTILTSMIPAHPENPSDPIPIGIHWTDTAKRILQALKADNNASAFLKPVDVVKFKIPHYLQVITNPMDLGTISDKLANHDYTSPQDYLDDVELVFANCIRFNGNENSYSKKAVALRARFERLQDQMAFAFWLPETK